MKLPFFSRAPSLVLARKDSAAFALHFTGPGKVEWTPNNYLAFVKEAYSGNVVAYQAINRLATAVASIKWHVYQDDKLLVRHPLHDLLRNPNPMQSGVEFWRAKISYLYLSGNGYDERVISPDGKLLELWTLRPDRMSIKAASTGLPAVYQYKMNNRTISFPADPHTGDSNIRHTKLFSPLNDFYGQSPIVAGSKAVDQHNEAMTWMQRLLQNSAKPSGAMSVPADTALSDAEFARLKSEMEDAYQGAENAGRPMLLEGGLTWVQMSLSPDDMELVATKDSAARDISLAFGVPPLLLSIPGDNTFANYREARLGFYEDTVIPLIDYLTDEMNAWLRDYSGGAVIRPDKDAIEAIAEKRKNIWEMVDNSDELTVNEARQLKGYPPISDTMRGEMLLADLRASTRGHDTPEKESPNDRLPGA